MAPRKRKKTSKTKPAKKIAKKTVAKAVSKRSKRAKPAPAHQRKSARAPKSFVRRGAQAALRLARRLAPGLAASRSAYDTDLDRNAANYQSLTPISFLERAANVFPRTHRDRAWQTTHDLRAVLRARATLASALAKRGIGKGDTVAVMLANTPPMLEAHYGVPMPGAVLNTLNTRLDAAALAFMLDHGEAKVLITDREFSADHQGDA